MPNMVAERIHRLIDDARKRAAHNGQDFDLAAIYQTVLVRCGVCREDAVRLVADSTQDPVRSILFFAGDAHNFALLAVEEALAAACAQPRAAA